MKKTALLSLFLLSFSLSIPLQAQHGGHNCGNCPHHKAHTADNKSAVACTQAYNNGLSPEILAAFPTAKSLKKTEKWTEVYDGKNLLIGYAVYSKPASDGIKGYAGETPLMIALNPKQEILCLQMLDNQETPSYLQLVVNAGLLKTWNGLKPAKARNKKVDAVSGATYSSNSIIQTLQAALKKI